MFRLSCCSSSKSSKMRTSDANALGRLSGKFHVQRTEFRNENRVRNKMTKSPLWLWLGFKLKSQKQKSKRFQKCGKLSNSRGIWAILTHRHSRMQHNVAETLHGDGLIASTPEEMRGVGQLCSNFSDCNCCNFP